MRYALERGCRHFSRHRAFRFRRRTEQPALLLPISHAADAAIILRHWMMPERVRSRNFI